MRTPNLIPMVTAENASLVLHYGKLTHRFHFAAPVGDTSIERNRNAIRIYWKYDTDKACEPWRDAFEIAVDDIGFDGATIHPLNFCECDDHDDDM